MTIVAVLLTIGGLAWFAVDRTSVAASQRKTELTDDFKAAWVANGINAERCARFRVEGNPYIEGLWTANEVAMYGWIQKSNDQDLGLTKDDFRYAIYEVYTEQCV